MKHTPMQINTLKHTFQHKHAAELGLMDRQTPHQQLQTVKTDYKTKITEDTLITAGIFQ